MTGKTHIFARNFDAEFRVHWISDRLGSDRTERGGHLAMCTRVSPITGSLWVPYVCLLYTSPSPRDS